MNYDLALKLKNAGFKTFHDSDHDCIHQCDFPDDWGDDDATGEILHYPTLSELIEACLGEQLDFSLNNYTHTVHWHAYAKDRNCSGNGSTPEEAVANLWLSLNNK